MKKALFAFLTVLAIIPGCRKHPGMGGDGDSPRLEYGQLEIRCGMDPWVGFEDEDGQDKGGQDEGGQSTTKSSIGADALEKIHDINALVFRYDRGELVFEPERSRYFTDEKTNLLVNIFDRYKIVFLANCGHNLISEVEKLGSYESICENLRVEYDGYSDGFRESGLPMVYSTDIDAYSTGNIDIRFKRLYSRWAVNMDFSELEYSSYKIKSMSITNAPKAIYPMSGASMIKNAGDACTSGKGDCLSEEDLDRLNKGETVYLYILENVQGELLPGNTNPNLKTPQYVIMKGHMDKVEGNQLTGIRIEASANTPWAVYDNVTYQAYLGENTCSDFSIVRNTPHRLTIKMSADEVVRWNWRIEPDQPVKVFDPRLDIDFETYRDNKGAWRPRISVTPADCDQLEALYGALTDKISMTLTISGQHYVPVVFRNISTWEYYNKLFLQNGGQIYGTPLYHASRTMSNGAVLEAYYTGNCRIYPKDYCRTCGYDSKSEGRYIFLPSKNDIRWTTECFISAIDPGQCEAYTVYNDWYDYDKSFNRYLWTYSPEDYRRADNEVDIILEVGLPEKLVNAVKEIYGKDIDDFVTTSYDISNGCPYSSSDLSRLGVKGVQFQIGTIGS